MGGVIALVGDVYIGRQDATGVLDRCQPFLDGAVSFANLEAPITDRGEDVRYRRPWGPNIGYRMRPRNAHVLKRFSAVSIANNHLMDFGLAGYLDTVRALGAAGVCAAGAGADADRAFAPCFVRAAGQKVALLAATCVAQPDWGATDSTPGMAVVRVRTAYEPPLRVHEQPGTAPVVRSVIVGESARPLLDAIERARLLADAVVISLHWGVSGSASVLEYQVELGRRCIDAGADIVFGHHPHVLQRLEVYRGKPILYSLGNLVSDDGAAGRAPAAVARCYWEGQRLSAIGLVPLVLDDGRCPVPAGVEVARGVLHELVGAERMELAGAEPGPAAEVRFDLAA